MEKISFEIGFQKWNLFRNQPDRAGSYVNGSRIHSTIVNLFWALFASFCRFFLCFSRSEMQAKSIATVHVCSVACFSLFLFFMPFYLFRTSFFLFLLLFLFRRDNVMNSMNRTEGRRSNWRTCFAKTCCECFPFRRRASSRQRQRRQHQQQPKMTMQT